MDIQEIISVLKTQESMLRFARFNNADALHLGELVIEMANRKGLPVSVSIRKSNGLIMFQYALENTELFNEKWLNRKHNTVVLTGKSTLRLHAEIKSEGENADTLQPWFLEAGKYSMYGGGFPIVVDGMGLVGTMCLSGLDHESDHDVVVSAISQYLDVLDVPRIVTGDIPK